MDDATLFAFAGADVLNTDGTPAIRGLDWTVRQGETWAIVGPVGAGKSALAEAIAGKRRVVGTYRRPSGRVRLVAFREDGWPFSYRKHYYQQRFNFVEPHDDVTLAEFLSDGTGGDVSGAARTVGIEPLLGNSFLTLSSGQARRARLARALVARPELLILDDPFLGVDVAGRADLSILLERVAKETAIVLVVNREALPGWVTNVRELVGACRGVSPRALQQASTSGGHPGACPGEPVIEVRNTTVRYGTRTILNRIDWVVRRGERWALIGPNGSGKTTLLSLLCGDHPQAYAQDVRIFGRRRGTGETIWELKRRIGLSSAELHLYFAEPLTTAETVATGFHDVLTRRPTTSVQDAAVRDILAELGLTHLASRRFDRLSTGEQRLVLLARALVKRPEIIILDEPFQCLDSATAFRVRDWLDDWITPSQTLLFVSHHADEIPRSVSQRLQLVGGSEVRAAAPAHGATP
ncbi:MAG: ATP-binding cassette domain-containing protein [Gemmataceae bacterium]